MIDHGVKIVNGSVFLVYQTLHIYSVQKNVNIILKFS